MAASASIHASKVTDFTDDNFKFDEYCRKFSNWVEKTVGIASNFLLFPQCFQKTCTADTFRKGLSFTKAASASIHASLELLLIPVTNITFFPSHGLLSHLTIVENNYQRRKWNKSCLNDYHQS